MTEDTAVMTTTTLPVFGAHLPSSGSEITLIISLTVLLGASVFLMLRAAERFPAPTVLIVGLVVLTSLALLGAIISGEAALIAAASAGIGALAGAVSNVYASHEQPRQVRQRRRTRKTGAADSDK